MLYALMIGVTFAADGVVTGELAPPLELRRLDDGPDFDLHSMLPGFEATCPGGVLVAFMGSWCGPCAESLPMLAELERAYPELDVVSVVVDETAHGRALELQKIRDAGITGPVLVGDAETGLAWTGGVRSVPRFVFVDHLGMVVAQDRGFGPDVAGLMSRQAQKALQR